MTVSDPCCKEPQRETNLSWFRVLAALSPEVVNIFIVIDNKVITLWPFFVDILFNYEKCCIFYAIKCEVLF